MEKDLNSSLIYNQPYKPTPINDWALLKSLVEDLLSLTVLAKSFFFFCGKFTQQKCLTFFRPKMIVFLHIIHLKF